jgi:iron complex outermembrane receptor protein
VESAVESIASARLGDHARTGLGLSAEHAVALGRGRLRAGLSAWRYSEGWGWEVSPGIDAAWPLGGGLTWHAGVERAFRVPTYTELYYASPAQTGNPDLGPEHAWTLETGLRGGAGGAVSWSAGVFVRRGTDLVDWVRSDPAEPWTARNVAEVTTRGVEAGIGWTPASGALERLGLDYAWLDADRGGFVGESRYVLDHLRHQAVLRADHRLPLGLEQSWRLRYEEPLRGEGEVVVDLTTGRRWEAWSVALEVTNLLGAERERFPGVPLPGRWVLLRVSRRFSWDGPAAAGS